MTTSTRIAGVGTILFDVGNTLAFVDLERVGDVLAAAGRSVAPDRLEAAEGAARLAMYAHAADHPSGRDEERWAAYVSELFRRIGLDDPDEAKAIRDRLAAAHGDANLWTRVPEGTSGTFSEMSCAVARMAMARSFLVG